MQRLLVVAVVSALSAAAAAQTTQALEEVRVSGASTRIELPRQLRNVWYDQFDQVKGTYYLSNGKTMQLSIWGNRMYAKIDGIDKVQLVAVSPFVFIARDRQMKIMIDDPEVSSSRTINATLLISAPLMSSVAPAGEFVTLLAHR